MLRPMRAFVASCALLLTVGCTQADDSLFAAEPELIFHPKQPMIVDVIIELAQPGEVEVAHASDSGVLVATLAVEDEGRRHHLRVRGLAPDSDHQLSLEVSASEGGASSSGTLDFRTDYFLPGFRPSFEVEVHDEAALDSAYRMFDYTYTPLWEPSGIYVVDTQGVSRWYLESGPALLPGPTSIWGGIEMLEDGSILALRDGGILIIDELGERRFDYHPLDEGVASFHHEVIQLANGNFLALGNSFGDVDYSALDPEIGEQHVAGDYLVEVNPAGEIVWTWDAFGHLDPQRILAEFNTGLEYINPETGQAGYDWTHDNGMVHSAEDDVILLSMRHQDWIVAIDHQSGDLLWRLGPDGDFELDEGRWFHHQHSPQWQADGTLLLYDNGLDLSIEPTQWRSRAVRYALDDDAMVATQVWEWDDEQPYLAAVASDADRTPAGNVLVLDSSLQPDLSVFDIGQNYSRLVEVAYEGSSSPIWSMQTKQGSFVYRATAVDRLPGGAEL